MKHFIIGITGASGSILSKTLLTLFSKEPIVVHVIATSAGQAVFEYELSESLESFVHSLKNCPAKFIFYSNNDLFAPIASGSFKVDAMVIIPCSMGSLAKIAGGISDNLLLRAADVMIKEKRQLVLIARETPLSSIHLKNMLALSDLGVKIMPPVPQFYLNPDSTDDMAYQFVGRLLAMLDISYEHHRAWQGK